MIDFKKMISRIISICLPVLAFLPFCIISYIIALMVRKRAPKNYKDARVVWGPSPIINNKYWSNSLKMAGIQSKTLMFNFSEVINKRTDFDEYVFERYTYLPLMIKLPLLFWESLIRFDAFFISFDGWLLGKTYLANLETYFLNLAGKRIIVLSYGSDAYVYRNIRSIPLVHGLLLSYPAAAREQDDIEKNIRRWVRYADCVIPGIMGIDGIGRWDIASHSLLCIDTDIWKKSLRKSSADGKDAAVNIVHAPNHTGFKGTEFVIDAVEQLKSEGLKVNLTLIQKMQNDEVRRVLQEDADILIEQLVFTGHGLNGVEGMASGLPVISNLEDETYTRIYRRYSYLNECPILSASPENIVDQLRLLITNPSLRSELGGAGRVYVEKYCSYAFSTYVFSNVLKFVYGEIPSLLNLFHPLISEYSRSMPIITHPLVNNKVLVK